MFPTWWCLGRLAERSPAAHRLCDHRRRGRGRGVATAVVAAGVRARARPWRFLRPCPPRSPWMSFNAQDIANRAQGPGFPWTLRDRPPAERAGLNWIRANTAHDALVQVEPFVSATPGTWAMSPSICRAANGQGAARFDDSDLPPYQRPQNTFVPAFSRQLRRGGATRRQRSSLGYFIVGAPERARRGE